MNTCLSLEKRIDECEKLLAEATGDAAWGYLGELLGLITARAGRPEDAAGSLFQTEQELCSIMRPRCEQGYRDGVMLIRLERPTQKGGPLCERS
jgi:hypothetical protein